MYNPRSKLPTVAASSEIILSAFHSLDVFLFLSKKDLIASKIYFADFVFRADWPNIIKGFFASLIKFDISWLSSTIFLILSMLPSRDSYG